MVIEYIEYSCGLVKEIFEQLHWGVAKETTQEGHNKTVIGTVSFTQAAIENLRTLGVNVTTPILAIETARTKKVAFQNAYPVVLEKLHRIGITPEWVEKYKGNKDFNNPVLAPYINTVQGKSRREGYEKFYLKDLQTTTEGVYTQLIGIKPDGKLVILSSAGPAESKLEGKRQALEKYAR